MGYVSLDYTVFTKRSYQKHGHHKGGVGSRRSVLSSLRSGGTRKYLAAPPIWLWMSLILAGGKLFSDRMKIPAWPCAQLKFLGRNTNRDPAKILDCGHPTVLKVRLA